MKTKRPVTSVIENTAEKIDTASWQRMGVLIGTIILTVFGGHLWTKAEVNDRVEQQTKHVDTVAAEQKTHIDSAMTTHWKMERVRKDSAEVARDSVSALKDDLHTRQNDTIIRLLSKHIR